MWRLRRATRCENGSIREAAIWKDHRDYDQVIKGLATDLGLLENAEAQLRSSGTLSQETYTKILPLVEEQKRSEHGKEAVSAEIDRALFLTCIAERKRSLSATEQCSDCGVHVCESHTEKCEACGETFCPGCMSFHRADHVKPPQVERLDRIRKRA